VSEDTRLRSWTRAEYDQLIDCGFFREDEPIELVAGQLVVREPQHAPHATAIRLANRALRRAFPDETWQVNVGLPIALDDESEPEPDLSVVPGGPRDYLGAHPARPVLVLEVSVSSLAFDRRVKSSIYARAGIADYWIVNLIDHVLEVYREPGRSCEAPGRWAYRSFRRIGPAESVSPMAAPDVSISASDLLP
jgi:Uma2 family endonuclease